MSLVRPNHERELPTRIRRVKTGCRTCKQRKVKCDEGKPSCKRCLSAVRHCEGYDIPGFMIRQGGPGTASGSRDQALRDASTQGLPQLLSLSKHHSPCALHCSSDTEKRYFEYFRLRAIPKLCGVFRSDFWDILVLQASSSEPLALHAATALGAAYKSKNQDVDILYGGSSSKTDADGEFAVSQYLRTWSGLRAQLQRGTSAVTGVVPILCLLLTTIKLVLGEHTAAKTHLSNGSKALSKLLGTSPATTEIDDINDAFQGLNIQSALISGSSVCLGGLRSQLTADIGLLHMPPVFGTAQNAQRHLHALLDAALRLRERFRSQSSGSASNPLSMKQSHERLNQAVRTWNCVFMKSSDRLRSTQDHRTIHCLHVLRVTHTMLDIMASTALLPESGFDNYDDKFASIISQAVSLWDSTGFAVGLFYEGNRIMRGPRVTMQAGIMMPLYYTAVKCRVPFIRRQAISMLDAAQYREGIWSSASVSRIARTVMELEEGITPEDPDIGADPGLLENMQTHREHHRAPGPSRFQDIVVVPTNSAATNGFVFCFRQTSMDTPSDPAVATWDSARPVCHQSSYSFLE
ncbi:hypothetical protein B0T10DRAFT_522860 [Thelonectria olida]|uniref:Zn(2)-C6 fungal-type domain-containing protein n=1 Tax=Thelonectria olida TaxID=1576542 RepID=A0A9P9AF07_9HYPO|nr:hypothetical protein B0T10DRAFT_522860 [Thelonectria olida]